MKSSIMPTFDDFSITISDYINGFLKNAAPGAHSRGNLKHTYRILDIRNLKGSIEHCAMGLYFCYDTNINTNISVHRSISI